MSMKKKNLFRKTIGGMLAFSILATIVGGCGCAKGIGSDSAGIGTNVRAEDFAIDVSFKDEDLDDSWEEKTATSITLSDETVQISGKGAAVKEGVLTISQAGTYILTGSLSDGQVIVDAGDEDLVRLVFNGVTLFCSDSAPVYVKNADKTVLILAEGSENQLSDGNDYVLDEEEEPNGTIFSKDDLTINGTGKLVVSANYNNGIVSKDDLKLVNGEIYVEAVNNGIKGKDSVAVRDGSYTVIAGGDGIKSDNTTDSDKGYVYIENGSFVVDSTDDAFHSDAAMAVLGGDFTVKTEDDGFHSEASLLISGGTIDIQESNEGIESAVIYIDGGDINIVASDDGINAAGGELAGSQSETAVNDQSQQDDGTNRTQDGMAGENADEMGENTNKMGQKPGGMGGKSGEAGGFMNGGMTESSSGYLYIAGGNITVDAEGDGLDSNTDVEMSGGYVVINGSANDGNGSLDYGNRFVVTGGTLIATGSQGMAVAPTDETTVNTAFVGFETAAGGSTLKILDSSGNEVLSAVPAKNYSSLVYSSDALKSQEDYTVTIDGETVASFTMTETVTTVGSMSSRGGNGQMTPDGDMGGNRQMTPPSGNQGGNRRMTPDGNTGETRQTTPSANGDNTENRSGTDNTL